MVVRVFVAILLILSVVSYFIPVSNSTKNDSIDDMPLLVFKDSTMYTLTTDNMNRIVYSKEVQRFRDRDVMYEGALTLKGKDKNNNEITDILYSDIIIKKAELYKFLKNVRFRRDDFVTLNTDELFYDSLKEVATNTLPFYGTYYSNKIKGESLYLDMNSYHMKSNNTHFEIEIEKN